MDSHIQFSTEGNSIGQPFLSALPHSCMTQMRTEGPAGQANFGDKGFGEILACDGHDLSCRFDQQVANGPPRTLERIEAIHAPCRTASPRSLRRGSAAVCLSLRKQQLYRSDHCGGSSSSFKTQYSTTLVPDCCSILDTAQWSRSLPTTCIAPSRGPS